MIRGIHYFSTELKTKIDVIPRGCFNNALDEHYDIIAGIKTTMHISRMYRADFCSHFS